MSTNLFVICYFSPFTFQIINLIQELLAEKSQKFGCGFFIRVFRSSQLHSLTICDLVRVFFLILSCFPSQNNTYDYNLLLPLVAGEIRMLQF